MCTATYVVVATVLTGMVPHTESAVADPLARALEFGGFPQVGRIVALRAIVSMSTVLLVLQYGQPRIFFAMARDGFLPQWAARVDPKTHIPSATTLASSCCVPSSRTGSGPSKFLTSGWLRSSALPAVSSSWSGCRHKRGSASSSVGYRGRDYLLYGYRHSKLRASRWPM